MAASLCGRMLRLAMLTPMPDQLDLAALAHVLFASPVQPSQCPSQAAIRAAITEQFGACHGDPAACVGLVAQEAGDHPDHYLARMHWARRSVARAYAGHLAVNARPRCGMPFATDLARGVA